MTWNERPGAPPPGTAICSAADLGERAGKGAAFGVGGARFELFVVRYDGALYAYVNDCPHRHTTLDLLPDQFFNRDKTRLLCRTHGAEFRVEDGYCVAGPCPGARLSAVPVEERAGLVCVGADSAGPA